MRGSAGSSRRAAWLVGHDGEDPFDVRRDVRRLDVATFLRASPLDDARLLVVLGDGALAHEPRGRLLARLRRRAEPTLLWPVECSHRVVARWQRLGFDGVVGDDEAESRVAAWLATRRPVIGVEDLFAEGCPAPAVARRLLRALDGADKPSVDGLRRALRVTRRELATLTAMLGSTPSGFVARYQRACVAVCRRWGMTIEDAADACAMERESVHRLFRRVRRSLPPAGRRGA